MRTYEKIETIFARDIDGTKKLIPWKYRDETVEFLKDCKWIWTEKVDGTNVRVCWDGHVVTFGGRTEKAQIPAQLVNRLNELFGGEQNAQVFEQLFGDKEVILFGEGYGNKIQAVGKAYNPDGVDFILFDVLLTIVCMFLLFWTIIVPIAAAIFSVILEVSRPVDCSFRSNSESGALADVVQIELALIIHGDGVSYHSVKGSPGSLPV